MYVQAAMLVAKYGKQLAIAVAIGLVMFAIWLAVESYENLQEELMASEAAAARQVVAHEITIASLGIQEEAAARWQASAERYQGTLEAQERARIDAREEGRRIEETLREHNLTKLALAKPELTERIVTRATHRIIRLLNCASTSGGCDEASRATGPNTSDSLSGAAAPGIIRLDSHGSRPLARSGLSLFLPPAHRLRSSST